MTMMEANQGDSAVGEAGLHRLLDGLRTKCGLKRDDLLERKIAGVLRQRPEAERERWACDLAGRLPGDPDWLAFVEAVTVHETYFFRDPGQLDVLAGAILPALLAERIAARQRRLRVWSAGCASGEEAYTVAMLALDALERLGERPDGWRIDILGSDISRAVVAQAREGIYGGPGLNAFRRMPERFACHFEAHGSRMRLTGGIAALARFRQHNLMDGTPPEHGFDIVLCRNVFIYFDDEAQRRAVTTLRGALRDGGHLLLGVTDRLAPDSGFERLDSGTAVIYRKTART